MAWAKGQKSGLAFNLTRNHRLAVRGYLDLILTPLSEVIDSTNAKRNIPLETENGLTQAQADFKKYFKDDIRERVVEICKSAEYLEAYALLGLLIEKCADVDPEMASLAVIAKNEFDEKTSGHNDLDAIEHIH